MTNETKTIDQLTDEFASTMAAQGTALNDQLKTLDADYKTARAVLVTQIASVDRVVRALNAKATVQMGLPARKPMSEQGKANIAAALKARRERMTAEAAQAKVTEQAATPSPATEELSAVVEAVAGTEATEVAVEEPADKKAGAKKGGRNARS